MKIYNNTWNKTKQTTNKRKAGKEHIDNAKGAAEPSGNLVDWTKGFCVMHCKEAFKRDTECTYGLCPICMSKKADSMGRRRRNDIDKSTNVCDHSEIQLQKTDCRNYLKKNRKAEDEVTMIPEYCWDCGDEF